MAHTLNPFDINQIFSLHSDGLSNRDIAKVHVLFCRFWFVIFTQIFACQ